MNDEAAQIGDITVEVDGGRWIDTTTRPWIVQALARTAAEKLAPYDIDAVACWCEPDSAVLAYAVAVALRVPVIQVAEDLGIVERVNRDQPRAARVAILAPQWSAHVPLGLLAAYLRNEGSEVPVSLSFLADGSDGDHNTGLDGMSLDGR